MCLPVPLHFADFRMRTPRRLLCVVHTRDVLQKSTKRVCYKKSVVHTRDQSGNRGTQTFKVNGYTLRQLSSFAWSNCV